MGGELQPGCLADWGALMSPLVHLVGRLSRTRQQNWEEQQQPVYLKASALASSTVSFTDRVICAQFAERQGCKLKKGRSLACLACLIHSLVRSREFATSP